MVTETHPHLSIEDAPTRAWTEARRATFPPQPKPTGRASVKTYLSCPFSEKEECKRLGGKWDPEAKKWYAPVGGHLEGFSRWL